MKILCGSGTARLSSLIVTKLSQIFLIDHPDEFETKSVVNAWELFSISRR